MITARIVKLVVERFSGIEDISIRSRELYISDCRFCYYKLCKTVHITGKKSLSFIGGIVKRDHTTVLHGVKQFDRCYKQKKFTANKVYIDSLNYLLAIQHDPFEINNFLDIQDVKQYYKIKHIKLTEKSHKVINVLLRKVELLTTNDFVKKILALDDDELFETEERFEIYFKVKETLNKKIIPKTHGARLRNKEKVS